ncbi:alpha/beta fold hydrolase [Thermomonas sp. HDW16]|uniref:alpha/beta hydrolase n=1 Tax=Thermomonas sp. HDW16 TaxID=2714945 RepID=UPI001F0E81BE|nr:alpha/beta fold hydrolase [Thermomonas sp. HDW16]
MLHLIHLLERRFSTQHASHNGLRVLLASALLLMLGMGLLLSGRVAAQDASIDGARIATRLLDHLDAGEYAQAEAMFGAEMAKAVPADKLKAVWESLPAQAGEAKGRGEAATMQQGEATLVKTPLHYAKAELVAKLAINADGKIVGFLIQPAETPAAVAPVADDANFSERDFSVGEGERALPGTLAMPKGGGPFPAVVLVHGSGPHDRDETIGPNKPFLDIARGLAAQGIAVLRYEKRSKARPQDFSGGAFGIDDETTNDAVLAVDALRKAEGIDGKRVFVLGHSQGGMMAPRIAAVSGHVAGLVLLAAPARPLLDIVIEQNRRMAVLDDGKTSDVERDAINQIIDQVRITRDPLTDPATKTVLGQAVGYWRSIDAVDAVAESQSVALPMLVLQGARDIQVVDADWGRWRGAFHDNPKVAFKLYDKLNHLGIAGEGDGNLAEYNAPGHVDPQLIDDVAVWIKAH